MNPLRPKAEVRFGINGRRRNHLRYRSRRSGSHYGLNHRLR